MEIYSTSNSLDFAKKIETHFPGKSLCTVTKQQFADGELNVTFNESIRGKQLVLIAQIEMPYENMFELFLTLDAARRSSAKEIIVVAPYLPHARQERRDENRSPITSRLFADFLQTAGADRLICMDIHTSAIEGNYTIPVDKLSPFNNFIPILKNLKNILPDMMLVSPDFGFAKKMEVYQSSLNVPMALIDKHREKANEVKSMKLIGEVAGKDVIIIDDIVDTATTTIKAANFLLEKGAKSIRLFATHAVLSNNARLNLMKSEIRKIYLTDTINRVLPSSTNNEANPTLDFNEKFEKITVTDIFANHLLKIEKEHDGL